jgi:hypothetical protein
MVASAIAAGVIAIGAAAPARTAPPTVWSTAASGAPVARTSVVHWPRRPSRRYAMDTPAGDRAIRQIVLDASARLGAGRDRDRVLDIVRADYLRVAGARIEAYDGIVRHALAAQVDRYLAALGEEPMDMRLLSELA